MPSDATSLSDEEFLDIAVRQKLLTPKDAAKLSKAASEQDTSLTALCLKTGLLKPVQIDVIHGLAERDHLAPGYEVVDLLGYGGLGIVFRARQPKLDRMVALKTIPMQRIENPAVIARFQQEAKAIGKLKHPNIVAAYDFGTHRDRLYLAMELVEGHDVDALIGKSGRVSESVAWALAQQVAAGLAHAEQHNLVHRDIKPGNLLLTKPPAGYPLPKGVPLLKITDFGLVQLETPDTDGTRLTMTGTSLGTPHYMAPEQIADAHVDSRADIYALGATVFHMIAGKPPFEGNSVGQVLSAKLKGDQKWLDRLPQGTSQATIDLLKQMMTQDPEYRIGDYNTLLGSIEKVRDGELPSLDVSSAETVDALLFSDTSLDGILTEESARVSIPQRNWLMWLTIVAVLLVGGALLYSTWPTGEPRLPPTQLAPSGVERPLFNGLDITDGWKVTSGGWFPTEDDMHSKVLSGKGAVTRRLPPFPSSPDELPQQFGLRFKIDLHNAQAAEVHFEHANALNRPDESTRSVLRITNECVALGKKSDRRGAFQPSSPKCPLPSSSTDGETSKYHELLLERQPDHWRVSLNGHAVTSKSVESAAPTEAIQFVVEGGQAYFADVFLVELTPKQVN